MQALSIRAGIPDAEREMHGITGVVVARIAVIEVIGAERGDAEQGIDNLVSMLAAALDQTAEHFGIH